MALHTKTSPAIASTSDWLPPIPGLQRTDPEHRYWLGDHLFAVSITGVVGSAKSDWALARIEATRHLWEPRGHTVHLALEALLHSRFHPQATTREWAAAQLEELRASDYGDWIEPLLAHPHWQEVTVIASERPTCCLVRNLAGTYDTAYLDPALPIPGDRPSWAAGPARVLADLKSLADGGSTYCTRAQIGGYMALESSQGQWFDYGQTIWCRPGRTQFSAPYSRRECLLAWAAAWSHYTGAHRPF